MVGMMVSRYRILARLGGGGMGVVYEAEDTALGRRVALKLLAEETAPTPEAKERFQREARAASALNHPHICTVHDAGVHLGQPYLVMERMQGRTLAQEIQGRVLPIERVLVLGEQIADALEAAHGASIVHRDLKPANLFVTERGDAKVLDFGLAKQVVHEFDQPASPDGPTLEHLTKTGTTLGTVAYMSPEQARGERLDARSDLFSFGVVLYEMATGKLPFPGESRAEQFKAILADPPIPPRRHNPDIPERLEALILECLEKDRALRCQSASEVRAKLKRLLRDRGLGSGASDRDQAPAEHGLSRPTSPGQTARRRLAWAGGIAVAAVAVVLAGVWVASNRGRGDRGPADGEGAGGGATRIAVLPFENLGAGEDAYFADGMADAVRGKLANLPGLAVIARGSSNEYRSTARSLPEIARELDVRYLLTATVRWQKAAETNRVRMMPELVEITGRGAPTTRWHDAFDADLSDVFAVQSRIATQVAQALEVALGATQRARLEERPTASLAAYDAYLQGLHFFAEGTDATEMRPAAEHFERATALDPGFAGAWAWLSLARSMLYVNEVPSPELGEAALTAVERAFDLSPRLTEAHWALGVYHRTVTLDLDRAADVLRRGLQGAPDSADILRNLGVVEVQRSHPEEALALLRRAAALDPKSWFTEFALSQLFALLDRPGESREAADRGLALSPANSSLMVRKAWAFVQEGDLAGARATIAGASREVERVRIVAEIASYGFSWVPDAAGRDRLLRLTPQEFGGDRALWADVLASERWLRGDVGEARRLAEIGRQEYVARIAQPAPKAGQARLHSGLARMLAIAGGRGEAVREAEHATALAPLDGDPWIAADAHYALAVVHTWLGNRDQATEALARQLAAMNWLTPGMLRVDEALAPLRGHPAFDRLAAGQP